MKYLILFILSFFLFSCNNNKEIKSPSGAIDIVSNVYFKASKGLEDNKSFHISKINYINDDVIELVPNLEMPTLIDSVFYIKDKHYYNGGDSEESKSIIFKEFELVGDKKDIYKKAFGAVWVNIPIFGYETRKDIADTTLYGKKLYKRFQISTKDNYSVFYIHKTDTILPYSFNRLAEKEYRGRIERIDSYDKKRDLFSTLWLIPRKQLDDEAKEIFEYNAFVQAEIEKAKKQEINKIK